MITIRFFLYFFCIIITEGLVGAPERWNAAEKPETIQEAKALEEKSEQEIKQAEARKKELLKRGNDIDTKEEDIAIERATYNLKTAQIGLTNQEQSEAIRSGDHQKEEEALEKNKQLATEREHVKDRIKNLTDELTTLLVQQGKNPEQLVHVADQLANVFSIDHSQIDFEYIKQIGSIRNVFENMTNINEIKNNANADKKIDQLANMRKEIRPTTEILNEELRDVQEKEKNREPSAYQKKLLEFKAAVERKSNEIDKELLGADIIKEQKQPGFFGRLARLFKEWYDRVFKKEESSTPAVLIKEIASINKSVAPFIEFIQSVENLEGSAREVNEKLKQVDKTTDSRLVQKLKDDAQLIIQQASLLEKTFKVQDQESINQSYALLGKITGDVQAYLHLYRDKAPTLFDNLIGYYESLIGNESELTSMYKILGVAPSATVAEIEQADTKNMSTLKQGTDQYRQARNAGYILRNPISRATYDAFLSDYAVLKGKGIDPKNPEKSSVIVEYLNDSRQSKLPALEISQAIRSALVDQVAKYLIETTETVGTIRPEFGESGLPPIFNRIGKERAALEDTLTEKS